MYMFSDNLTGDIRSCVGKVDRCCRLSVIYSSRIAHLYTMLTVKYTLLLNHVVLFGKHVNGVRWYWLVVQPSQMKDWLQWDINTVVKQYRNKDSTTIWMCYFLFEKWVEFLMYKSKMGKLKSDYIILPQSGKKNNIYLFIKIYVYMFYMPK